MNVKKYVKYPSEEQNNRYFAYCGKWMIPIIQITKGEKGNDLISIDLIQMNNEKLINNTLEEFEACSERLKKVPDLLCPLVEFYHLYFKLLNIPSDRFSWCGGSGAIGFQVLPEHSEMIANCLFDYVVKMRDDFYKKEGVDLSKQIKEVDWE